MLPSDPTGAIMNRTKTSSELKANAKEYLLGHYGKMILALFTANLIPVFILFLADDFLAANTTVNIILYYAVSLIVSLLTGILSLGTSKLYMNFCTGREAQTSDIFYGFTGHHQDVGILLAFVQIGIMFLSLLPFFAVSLIYLFIFPSAFLYPVMALTLIAGVVFGYTQILSLSQCYYLAVDFPDYTVRQLLSMSRRIMKGQRARLFYIHVSFLPLVLLCVFTMGLGLLWLLPYISTTLTCFYLDLIDYHTKQYR